MSPTEGESRPPTAEPPGMSNGGDTAIELQRDTMAPEAAQRLAAVLDCTRRFNADDEIPLLYHWAYFAPAVERSQLGPDGHPRRHDRFADCLPRRMAASGSVRSVSPLLAGRPATRSSKLERVDEKLGRTGPLAFAHWRHHIDQDGHTVLDERQTLVYRAKGRPEPQLGPWVAPRGTHATTAQAPGGDTVSGRRHGSVVFDATMLFQYSAVTWNSHRIHYDWQYATGVEGYPGLVVHGPLLATVLAAKAEELIGHLATIHYRAHATVFAGQPVDVFTRMEGSGHVLAEARLATGQTALTLEAGAEPECGHL